MTAAITAAQGSTLLQSRRGFDIIVQCKEGTRSGKITEKDDGEREPKTKDEEYTAKHKNREGLEHSWYLHKVILSTNSEYFDRLCYGDCRAPGNATRPSLWSAKDGAEDRIVLYDEDPEVLDAAFTWMYTKLYRLPVRLRHEDSMTTAARWKEDKQQQIQFHLEVYSFCDRIAIDELKDLAVCQIKHVLEWQLNHTSDAGKTIEGIFRRFVQSDLLRSEVHPFALRACSNGHSDEKWAEVLNNGELGAWKSSQAPWLDGID